MRHGVGRQVHGSVASAAGVLSALLLAASASTGCTPMPAYQIVRSDVGTEVPRSAGCSLELMPRPPRRRHEQIGIIEQEALPVRTQEEFIGLVRDRVCAIGGEVIVTEKKNGVFLGGAIVRYLPER